MSVDNNHQDNTKEKSPLSPTQQQISNLKRDDIEKNIDEFLLKNRYKDKVGQWLRDISPISSPRSLIEKYYNENNPFALDEWTTNWGINTKKYFSSLWTPTSRTTYTPEEKNHEEYNWDYMDMRKKQNSDWAHEMTYKGVKLAKSNEYEKAIKVYSHAIEIDPECVDAYVAKGAAYANQEHYILAIRNFEKALQIDPKCVNAKKYLKATQNKKAEEDKIKEMERKKQEEEERIKRENQTKDDLILDNSKLITSPLFMDMITISPSRADLKPKSKSKKKRKKHHRSRSRSKSRNRKKHKRHHSSRSKSHKHSSSSKKKNHSHRHSSRYSTDSSSSSLSSSDTYSDSSSSSDYSSDSSYSREKERKSHHYRSSSESSDESEDSRSDNSDNSDNRHHSSKRKRSSHHHHHKSHNKKRRNEEDRDRSDSYSPKYDLKE